MQYGLGAWPHRPSLHRLSPPSAVPKQTATTSSLADKAHLILDAPSVDKALVTALIVRTYDRDTMDAVICVLRNWRAGVRARED